MIHHGLHPPLAEPLLAVGVEHKYIPYISIRGIVRDDARKTHLLYSLVNTDTERVGQRTPHGLPRYPLGPVWVGEELVDHREVEPRAVSAQHKLATALFQHEIFDGAHHRSDFTPRM